MAAWLDICRYLPTAGGTTDWTFSAAVTGYQSPTAAGVANGRLYKYRAESSDLSQWELGEGAYNTATGVLARTTVLFNSLGNTAKINFSTAPQVAIVALKEDLISVEEANAFSATQQSQARSNIDAAGLAAMASKNVVINAAVDISQELASTGATLVNSTQKYTADQWAAFYTHAAATAVVISKQFAIASIGAPLAGFQFVHLLQATTAITSPASGDYAVHRHFVEGSRIAHWGWGAAGAASISVAFQLYSTVSGTAFVRLSNGATATRFYYHEFAVAAGWNFVSFTAPGDTTGTWATDTSKGLTIEIFSSGKETTPQASLDSWGATAKLQTTNSTNLLGTANNATGLTGLYVDANGGQLPLAADLPLLMRPADQEIYLCNRYFCSDFPVGTAPADNTQTLKTLCAAVNTTTLASGKIGFPVKMRAVPTITFFSSNVKASPTAGQWQYFNGTSYVDTTGTAAFSTGVDGFSNSMTATVTNAAAYVCAGSWSADARM